MDMKRLLRLSLCCLTAAALGACGGGSSGSSPANGTVNMLLSDASTQDWAVIGVRVLSISLIPQGGGTPVPVYTAPTPAPFINLVQLDQLGEILGNVQVPAGTYTGAKLSISANSGDVLLTVANDPQAGFAGINSPGEGQPVPANQIQIQKAAGATSVPLTVTFDSPLVVTANQSNALDLEFDLSHPAFIVDHVSPAGTFWAVNFNGPVRHHPIADVTKLVLRHLYGTVTGVASDNTSVTVTKDYPVHPATTPETFIASSTSLQILADATNGTILYDLDAKTSTTVKDFSSVASTIDGKYVRVAARYQDNGTLVAVRLYVSSTFDRVWVSPEGHVLHVNPPVAPSTTGSLVVENEDGQPVTINVDGNTNFYFQKQLIHTGADFLAKSNSFVVRGFKVHVDVDPLDTASPRTAESVDVEIAHFNGLVSSPSTTGFTYTRNFVNSGDDYTKALPYISSTTPNGRDASGNAIDGFKWWYLTFPTLADTGAKAISDFVSAAGGSVSFGGTPVVTQAVFGDSYATWNDPAKANDWSARWAVLIPTPAPLSAVSTAFTSSSNSFAMTAVNIGTGASPVTVDLGTVSGSATLVYQVDSTGGIVTVSPEDVTNPTTLAAVAGYLVPGTKVKVFGVPETNGHLKAYVLFYFTGTAPRQ